MKGFIGRLIKAALCVMLITLAMPLQYAGARESFSSYLYDSSNQISYAPNGVSFAMCIDKSILGTEIASLSDIACGPGGELYILDSGGENSDGRIIVYDKSGSVRIISSFMLNGKEETLSSPMGLTITPDYAVYVADTGNRRIIELDAAGQGVRAIYEPSSALLGAEFGFNPIKLAIDSVGQIYIVSADYTNGLIVLDINGEYLRSMGVPKVTVNPAELFWKSISTQAQLDQMEKSVPTEFNNVAVDENDFLYVTANKYSIWDYMRGDNVSLKKMNAKGSNIIRESAYGSLPYGDLEISLTGTYKGGSSLADAIPLGNGMFAVLDDNRCRAFVYNENSDLLFVFGGPGAALGTFKKPGAMAYCNGRFYVADTETGEISVFAPTEYGKGLLLAAELETDGRYEEEEALWQKILDQNANNTIALTGLARSAYNNGKYAESMEYFKKLGDTENYSKAFYVVRRNFLQSNSWLFVLAFAAVPIIAAGIALLKKRRIFSRLAARPLAGQLAFSRRVIFRPLSGFWDLIRENGGSLPAALIILGAATTVMLLNTYATGYIFSGRDSQKTALIIPLLQLALPLLIFSLCNWCVSSLLDGKGTFKSILTVNCYSLTPLLILLPPAILLSNVLALQEGGIYRLIIGVAAAWVILLIIAGNKQVHDYSMSKSLLVLFITVLVMVILLFLSILLYILVQQMAAFIIDLLRDIAVLI